MNRGPSAPARIESAGRQADRRSLSWLEPSVRLSGLLSFSRKYLLIGVVVVLALGALSFPLVQGLRHELAVAERERLGLRAVLSATELLADLVRQRDVPRQDLRDFLAGPLPVRGQQDAGRPRRPQRVAMAASVPDADLPAHAVGPLLCPL